MGSTDGSWNSPDETEFEYHPNITQELEKLISKMPATKTNIPLGNQTLDPSCVAGAGGTSMRYWSYLECITFYLVTLVC